MAAGVVARETERQGISRVSLDHGRENGMGRVKIPLRAAVIEAQQYPGGLIPWAALPDTLMVLHGFLDHVGLPEDPAKMEMRPVKAGIQIDGEAQARDPADQAAALDQGHVR